jgi:F0F1-type ATP synthase assembly protein I
MITKIHKSFIGKSSTVFKIAVLSAWGFLLVATSFLFLWIGYLLDRWLDTSPRFMLGLFFLAVAGCFIELYDEVRRILKKG